LKHKKESARVAENNVEKFLDKKTEQEVESILSGGEAAYGEEDEINELVGTIEELRETLSKLSARGAVKSKKALDVRKSITETEEKISDLTKQKQVKSRSL